MPGLKGKCAENITKNNSLFEKGEDTSKNDICGRRGDTEKGKWRVVIGLKRGITRPRATHEGNKSHNHELKADKRLIFTLARIPLGVQKYSEIEEKCLYCSSFFCFSTLHAGTGGIHKFFNVSFLIMLVF